MHFFQDAHKGIAAADKYKGVVDCFTRVQNEQVRKDDFKMLGHFHHFPGLPFILERKCGECGPILPHTGFYSC